MPAKGASGPATIQSLSKVERGTDPGYQSDQTLGKDIRREQIYAF